MVLSPPCGMVTLVEHGLNGHLPESSKPTVWDGDKATQRTIPKGLLRSKPTVWDCDVRTGSPEG